MELGNMVFGNSRGEHHVDRDLQDEFCELLERMGFDGYGHKDDHPEWAFENEVFRIQPYYWGDCECGYDERESAWCAANKHRPDCYQSEVDAHKDAWDAEHGFKEIERRAFGKDDSFFGGFDVERDEPIPGVMACVMRPRTGEAMEAWRKAYSRRDRAQDKARKEMCQKHGLSYPSGCAVHCTCDYRDRWQAWSSQNDHEPTCSLVTPNFLHKPSGFRLDWYKYPLRDSYSNAPLTRELMRSMFRDCAESLKVIQ